MIPHAWWDMCYTSRCAIQSQCPCEALDVPKDVWSASVVTDQVSQDLASHLDRFMDSHKAPPMAFVLEVLQSGKFCPDEKEPYDRCAFHCNWKGYEMGHKDQAARKQWFTSLGEQLSKCGSWENVNIYEADADYAMKYGDHVFGRPFPFRELKPMLEKERQQMIQQYAEASGKVQIAEPGAWQELTSNPKYRSYKNIAGGDVKPKQPDNTVEGVYRGCISALPEMWSHTERIAAAGSSSQMGWSIKKLLRVMKKMVEKYDRHPAAVTDISRSSIVFKTVGDLTRAMDFALENCQVVTVKNRFNEPEDGYSDILLNLLTSDGFVVEVQLHLAPIYGIKGESGHVAFKWFRRLIHEDDHYEGDVDDKGHKHGIGRWIGANGDLYTGNWKSGKKHGKGVYTDADGHRFEGTFNNDMREGECVFTYLDGSTYAGTYHSDKKEGYGIFSYADGQTYDGQWVNGKRHGKGTYVYPDGGIYEGEWVKHKRHGQGSMTHPDKTMSVGPWENDEFQKDVSVN